MVSPSNIAKHLYVCGSETSTSQTNLKSHVAYSSSVAEEYKLVFSSFSNPPCSLIMLHRLTLALALAVSLAWAHEPPTPPTYVFQNGPAVTPTPPPKVLRFADLSNAIHDDSNTPAPPGMRAADDTQDEVAGDFDRELSKRLRMRTSI